MGYSELIKSLDTIRGYVRSFYVYGFRGRGDFSGRSGRTYDDERRRLENYLSGFMSFRSDEGGKVSFVSIDSRRTSRNPLYKIFKAKSFTAMDISLHFMLMDILRNLGEEKPLSRILDEISSVYLDGFSASLMPEESTLRKKLGEYCALGLVRARKEGKAMLYSRTPSPDLTGMEDLLSFFSEAAPCGVVGSFLLDKLAKDRQDASDVFEFKHHYITASIESDIMCTVFGAIREKRSLVLLQKKSGRGHSFSDEIVPLVVYQSAQGGRLYVMAYKQRGKRFMPIRADYILSAEMGEPYGDWDQRRAEFEEIRRHIWGVAIRPRAGKGGRRTAHVSFTVRFDDGEEFIYERLLREKRCGEVTRLNRNTARFDADIYDAQEIFPWARTFICRITDFSSSDESVTKRFYDDIRLMDAMYRKGEAG